MKCRRCGAEITEFPFYVGTRTKQLLAPPKPYCKRCYWEYRKFIREQNMKIASYELADAGPETRCRKLWE